MPRLRFLPALLTALLMFAGGTALRADAITVFAAASLGDALIEVGAAFEAETGQDVVISAAGSSALARQIQFGAPADLFVSANPAWMDALEADGLLIAGTRVDLLGNSLVLIGPPTRQAPIPLTPGFDLPGRLGEGRLAMALIEAVPAGIYGAQALAALGWLDDLRPHIAQADNVRAAMALVALREAPFGIVYATDALAEPRVSVAGFFPEDSHDAISYPLALIRESEAARSLHGFLQEEAAKAIFLKRGFTVLAE